MVARYSNGYIPDSALITFNVGYSAGEGQWKHQLSPATYAKHLALIALARKNTGRTLQISAGWGAYRPYPAQVYARSVHGNGAAWPGTSSHGGFWEGQQTLAIDYGNWSYVYNGSREAFYRDVRAVGLEPGLISPHRGYPDEPWHVVDKSPWAAGAVPAGGSTAPNIEEDDMFTDEDRARAQQLERDVAWLKTRVGGKDGEPTISSNLTGVAGIVQWLKERIGGSTKTSPSVTDELRRSRGTTNG